VEASNTPTICRLHRFMPSPTFGHSSASPAASDRLNVEMMLPAGVHGLPPGLAIGVVRVPFALSANFLALSHLLDFSIDKSHHLQSF
jgi:hypothetical protein